MKRKIFNVIFALVLVLGLSLVTAVPASAADPTNHYVIPSILTASTGDATSEISTTQIHSGSNSVHLQTTGTLGSGHEARVRILMPSGTTLNDISAISWWEYLVAGYPPHVDIKIDTDGNGTEDDALVIEYAYNTETHVAAGQPTYGAVNNAWFQTFSDDGDGPTIIDNNANAWLSSGPSGPLGDPSFIYGTLSHWKAGTVSALANGATHVTALEIEIDNWIAQTETYVDTISLTLGSNHYYVSIQDAIDAAASSDTINVAAGTYNENVNVNKSLTLTGVGSTTTAVTAAVTNIPVFNVTASSVNISGFTVTGATVATTAGIYLGNDVTLCHISDNILTGNGDGIWLGAGSNHNTITNNTVVSNNTQGFEIYHSDYNTFIGNAANTNTKYGFKMESASHNTFTNNLANSNGKHGFYLVTGPVADSTGCNYNTFENNTVDSNSDSGIRMNGRYAGDSNHNTLTGNTFSNNLIGIAVSDGFIDVATMTVTQNNIVGNTNFGISNAGTGTLNAENNWWGSANGPTHVNNTFNVGSQGDVVSDSVDYVPWLNGVYGTGTSFSPVKNFTRDPATQYSSIQTAIDAASPGDDIKAIAGTFTEDIEIPDSLDNLFLECMPGATIKGVAMTASSLFPLAAPNINVLADGVRIYGFRIQGPDPVAGYYSSGMVIGGKNVEIYNNAFEVTNSNDDTLADVSQGIQTYNKLALPGVDISGLNIHENTFTHQGAGTVGFEAIYINLDEGTDWVDIQNNTFSGYVCRGITTERSKTRIFVNSIVTDVAASVALQGINIQDPAVHPSTQDNVIIVLNTIEGSETGKGFQQGIRIGNSAGTQEVTNIFVERNAIQLNVVGIKVRSSADGVFIFDNDILGNTTYGVENTDSAHNLSASYNYWGDASGPLPDRIYIPPYYRGTGDTISSFVTYEPWLTTTQATVVSSGIRYYGYNWCNLSPGWNVWSTPIALDPGCDTWGEYKALGNDLELATGANAFYFDSASQTWASVTDSYRLTPCDAIYIKMAYYQVSPILYSPNLSVPTKSLSAGWNLISACYLNNSDYPDVNVPVPAETALASVYYVPGANNVGYSLVVSPAAGQTGWVAVRGTEINRDIGQDMYPCKGYWVYMINPGTFAGTVFTPVSPPLR